MPRRHGALRLVLACGAGLAATPAATAEPAGAVPAPAVTPAYAPIVLGHSLQFAASLGGADGGVVWQVDNATGGSAAAGTITAAGLYTAPAILPQPPTATVTAVAAADAALEATATVTLLARPPSGHTFFVAPGGSDTNPGSRARPWRTLQHAAGAVRAGDTVLVRGGVYRELVRLTRSGNDDEGFITFAPYAGETATVDGTGLPVPGGQAGLVTLADASFVVVAGFELRNYRTDRRSEVPIGIYVEGAGRNVQRVENHIHDIRTTAPTNPSQCGSDAFGITAYGTRAPAPIAGLVVSGNELDHLETGCSETLSVDGNVENFVIAGNLVHDDDNIGIGAIGFERVAPDPAFDQARDGEIRGNTLYDITSFGNPDYGRQYAADGIYVDGGTRITIEQNLVHDVDLGIELASEHRGHVTSLVTARNNVVYADNANGISIGGYGPARGGTRDCTIVNNTLFADDTKNTGSGEFQIQYYANGNRFENNIVYATSEALLVDNFTASEADPATLDYNLYYSARGAAKSVWVWERVRHIGFAAYRTATGEDAHSPPFLNPRFAKTGNPADLEPRPGSPALGTGLDLGPRVLGTVDFAGNPRTTGGSVDLGAYQHQ